MRDAKLFFHRGGLPTDASEVVDANSTEPGVGTPAFFSATVTGHTATDPVTVVMESSAEEAGTFTEFASFTIPIEKATLGRVILSVPLPTTAKRFIKTTWTGLAGGSLADGLDWGLKDGTAATHFFNA